MRPLGVYVLGGHSDTAQDQLIRSKGYLAWAERYVSPAVKIVRAAGRDPVVIHRFPGAAFGSWNVQIGDCLAGLRKSDWCEMVRHVQMPKVTLGGQAKRTPTEVRAYFPSPIKGTWTEVLELSDLCRAAGCGAYFEDVVDDARRKMARAEFRPRFFGCEPFYTRGYAELATVEPCFVHEKHLDELGADFRGAHWPSNWVPLAAGQRRLLCLNEHLTSAAAIAEREAAGWDLAVWGEALIQAGGLT